MREKCLPAVGGAASRLISAAAVALKKGDFCTANRLHCEAVAADPSPRTLWHWGRCLLFQGKHDEAARVWLSCWERAKSTGSPADRAQACAALSRLFREAGNQECAVQFHQLSLTATAEIWRSTGYEPLPEALRLNAILEQQPDLLPRESMEQLQIFVAHCHDVDLRGLARLSLGDLLRESGALGDAMQILLLSLEDFRQAGNRHGAMTTLEGLAAVLLAFRRAESARRMVLAARKFAVQIGARFHSERLTRLANRLKRALAVRECTPLLN